MNKKCKRLVNMYLKLIEITQNLIHFYS